MRLAVSGIRTRKRAEALLVSFVIRPRLADLPALASAPGREWKSDESHNAFAKLEGQDCIPFLGGCAVPTIHLEHRESFVKFKPICICAQLGSQGYFGWA